MKKQYNTPSFLCENLNLADVVTVSAQENGNALALTWDEFEFPNP